MGKFWNTHLNYCRTILGKFSANVIIFGEILKNWEKTFKKYKKIVGEVVIKFADISRKFCKNKREIWRWFSRKFWRNCKEISVYNSLETLGI